jgi:hypothetical protein
MRRVVVIFGLAVVMIAGLLVTPGNALYGPDPDWVPSEFSIVLSGQPPEGALDRFDQLDFSRSTGWDFGDREGYECATIEYVENGAVVLELTFERVLVPGQDANYVEINDRFGVEGSDPQAPPMPNIGDHCGLPAGVGQHHPRLHDGSDHFPHHTMLHFMRGGAEFASLDLMRNECANGYWTPGDEAGEAWLWWDDDGPRNDGHHDLACGGGPEEPEAVLRLWVSKADEGITFCTMDSLDGDMCSDAIPGDDPPGPTARHDTRITMRLSGHLRATGKVDIPDGTSGCRSDRTVEIQRHHNNRWRAVGSDTTADSGRYVVNLPNRSGTYRARVFESSITGGDTCAPANSHREQYRR